MAGQTPNYDIRYPEMLDPADIVAVQHIAEDSEEELGILLDEVAADSAGKITWSQATWAPTVTNMALGNGSITGSAFRLGQLVWVDFEILPHPTNPPTTAWLANQFPNIIMPPSLPISLTVNPGGHNLVTAKIPTYPYVVNMAVEISPTTNALALVAIEGAMRLYNHPSVSLGGTSVWANDSYVKGSVLYITSAAGGA